MKKPFLLVEVLIAFSLVALCIVPLVRSPLQMLKNERSKLEEAEKQRLADWAFSEAKEMLLKHEIPSNQIPKMGETTGPFPLPDQKIKLPGVKEKPISCHFTLYGKGKREGPQGQDYRMIYLTIVLDTKKYLYRVPLQKLS